MPTGIYPHRSRPVADRFWPKVDKSGGPDACWPWTRCLNSAGYGSFVDQGKSVKAHRMAYTLAIGPIPKGLFVCHHCDNPKCCNPAHLFLGTADDNMRDMVQKKRAKGHSGEENGRAKITNQDVLNIRADAAAGMIQKDIARKYGIGKSEVQYITSRHHWDHI